MKPSRQLQRIIKTCGMSRYEISKRTGVSQAVLSQFVQANRSITTDTVDNLADVLGISIVADRKPRKGKGR